MRFNACINIVLEIKRIGQIYVYIIFLNFDKSKKNRNKTI